MGVSLAVLLLLLCGGVAQGQGDGAPPALPYTTPDSCLHTEIFQSGNLSCVQCAENSVPSVDGLSCRCSPGSVRSAGDSSSTPHCTPCADEEVSSQDSLFCLTCSSPLLFESSTVSCSACPSNLHVYTDTLPASAGLSGSRECISCPPGTWSGRSGLQCDECGIADCGHCSQNNTFGGLCFSSSTPLPSPITTSTFPYYMEHFTAAVGQCHHGNQTACQLVINLCVLQRYSRTDPACEESISSTSPLLPSTFFPEHGADEVLASTDIDISFSTTAGEGTHTLPLIVASYSLSGDFLGLANVTDQLLICRDLPPRYEAAWKVGVRYEVECSVGVASLSHKSQPPIFYDLYLHDRSGSSDVLWPVPVLPEDYVDGEGEEVNRGGVRGDWQLVTRFFLSEGVSSSPRYARRMRLTVELGSGGHILTPFLRVSYRTWEPDPASGHDLKASFATEYSQDVTGFNIGLSVCVVVMATLVAVYCGFQVNGYLRRSGGLCCQLRTYIFMIAEFSGGVSSSLFLLLSVSCTFILIIFKAQVVFFYALPFGTQLLVFQILLPLALLFRLLHLAHLLWLQCSVDIFLVDWERPKTLHVSTNQNQEKPPVAPPTTPVSIWRTYFVANEWNELQSLRRGHPTLLLLLSLLLLQVAGLQHLAEHDPTGHVTTSEERYSAPHSPLLRFSLTALTFTTIAILMRLYMFLVYERFVEHKIHQFVDLCSVSNVSVFIMSHRLHGYYIHGRSVHGHADTGMREMSHNLYKEQEDMCGRRGLLPDSDLQTFQMALTQQFRSHFDQIIAPLQAERAEGHSQPVRGGARDQMPRPPPNGVSEVSITAYERLNLFLSSFLEQSLRDLDYVSKRKLLLERVLDMEFYDPLDRSFFYEDPAHSFDSLLFYGREWSLFQLELLVFATADMLAADYVLAAVVTFIVSWTVAFLRDVLGQRNLKRKTLVDERFLI